MGSLKPTNFIKLGVWNKVQWVDIQFHPSRRILRQFAGLWLTCFGVSAAWEGAARQHTGLATVLAILAGTVGPVGLIWPKAVRSIYVGWMVLVFPLGWIISQTILAMMFYGLLTPISLVFRIIGRDSLHRTQTSNVQTYWSPKATSSDLRRYLRQF
jgi:hypothetical protein